jgi:putative endonuclease
MWYVYILFCNDRSLYTGSTTDLKKRVAKHNSGKASKYTRSRLPVKLVYKEKCLTRSGALKRENEIKDFCAVDKRKLAGLAERWK